MEYKDLRKLVDSEQIQCTNYDCFDYGNFGHCNTHLYLRCDKFHQWYYKLSKEALEQELKTMRENDHS